VPSSETGSAAAVVGMQWGDEGKGKVIDRLAADMDAVVRYNGGANAGHTVVVGEETFAVHLVPTGVFHPGARAIIAHGVAVDPFRLIDEIDGLSARGVDLTGLLVSSRAHVVAPYHIWEDEARERVAEEALTGEGEIGTTRRGIGPCYADKALRIPAIRVGDLLRANVLRSRVSTACSLKLPLFERFAPERAALLDPDAIVRSLLVAGERLRPLVTETTELVLDLLDGGARVLFEGANATLLDVDLGTFPYVTSSSCGVSGIGSGAGVPPQRVNPVIGVAKAYTTRVGRGPMPTELTGDVGDRIRECGAEFGTTTGRPRRTGWLDLVALRYAVRVNGVTELALTKLDVLGGFDGLRVCVGYHTEGGGTEGRFIADGGELERLRPVWKDMPAFPSEPVEAARRWDELPEAARAYVQEVERFVGVPVGLIGVGPERDQCLRREGASV